MICGGGKGTAIASPFVKGEKGTVTASPFCKGGEIGDGVWKKVCFSLS